MSDLTAKKCIPCEGGGIKPLTAQEAEQLRVQVPEWQCVEQHTKLTRQFTFRNFRQSLAFVNKVGEVAEQEMHHPDITFGWGYCTVVIQTHAIKGLHENDFILAAKIDAIQA